MVVVVVKEAKEESKVEKQERKVKVKVIFTYGTLKRGFSNHPLLQDLIRSGDAVFLGTYRTKLNYPLVCGPYRVPFLINLPGSGQPVLGEVYAVSAPALARLDELEGTTRGHYQRLPIQLHPYPLDADADADADEDEDDDARAHAHAHAHARLTSAEAYYAHSSYASNLWLKNGCKGLSAYTHEEARGYVKRNDRPQHLTFLDHIRSFISQSQSQSQSQ
ncbi:Gamma-glutamylcyclotransferase, AIG2-like [Trema orientale]|uniref:Gamma-glutamylcyclotransferase family protein n=1 Tax=Trema orientale TaxID=63057 RepID=A0A2P5BL66_TREOI|nr:Gamma-glutamylcyclotransferase, AIG2-like [Trema orientale]